MENKKREAKIVLNKKLLDSKAFDKLSRNGYRVFYLHFLKKDNLLKINLENGKLQIMDR